MKKILHGGDKVSYKIVFDGFYEAAEVREAIRIMKDILKADDISVNGYDSMQGYSIKDGIRLSWIFNNWDCITWEYGYPDNKEEVSMILRWADVVFNELLKKFPN